MLYEIAPYAAPMLIPLVTRRRCGWYWYVIIGTFPPKWCRKIRG